MAEGRPACNAQTQLHANDLNPRGSLSSLKASKKFLTDHSLAVTMVLNGR